MNRLYLIMNEDAFLASESGRILFFKDEDVQAIPSTHFEQHFFQSDAQNDYYLLVCKSDQAIIYAQELSPVWKNLRSQLGQIPEAEFQTIGRAQQILRWYKEHQFCGQCGAATERHARDFAMTCAHCKLDFYPKLSPCVMVLITRGNECLLAQHSRSQSPRYSCLAGFIEAGETPEQTLVREVMEEVGLKVQNPRYLSSQAWPFPGQLMLGYVAEYLEGEISIDEEEINAAGWFNAQNLPEIPPLGTLSRQLIDYFFEQQTLSKP